MVTVVVPFELCVCESGGKWHVKGFVEHTEDYKRKFRARLSDLTLVCFQRALNNSKHQHSSSEIMLEAITLEKKIVENS